MEPLKDNPTLKKIMALQEGRANGTLTQAEYERKTRILQVELRAAADKERLQIKTWAIQSGKVRDEAEYKRLCAHYHDAYGDSFHHFLTSIHGGAGFVTLNEKMLDDARLLELRFGGKIMDMQQAADLAEREAAEAKELAEREAAEKAGKADAPGS